MMTDTAGVRTSGHRGTDGLRVLVVDDGPDVRFLVRRLLSRRKGFTVVGEAEDGIEAISAAADLQPHVVLLDLAMPRMCGEEALPRILAVAPSSMVTVFSTALDAQRRLLLEELGAFRCYDKVDLPRLPDLIRQDYDRYQAR